MRGKKAKKLRKAVKKTLEREGKMPYFSQVLRKIKKLSVGVSMLALMLIMCTPVLADKVSVPFDCWPRDLQARFAAEGYELEITPCVRTPRTWAFLQNEGSQYHIMTYKPVTVEELEMIKDVSTQSYLDNRR